jgi:hypothetical protein
MRPATAAQARNTNTVMGWRKLFRIHIGAARFAQRFHRPVGKAFSTTDFHDLALILRCFILLRAIV